MADLPGRGLLVDAALAALLELEVLDGVRDVDVAALDADLEREITALEATANSNAPLDVIEIKPKRGNVDVRLVALAWQPLPG